MMKMFIMGAAAVLAVSVLSACTEKVKPGTVEVKRREVSGLRIEAVVPAKAEEYYETSGTVRSKTVSSVASRVMGTVTSIRVKEGDRVKTGTTLLTLDDRDMVQRVKGAGEGYREAEKGLEAAKEGRNLAAVTFERYKRLYDEKALTGQELDQIATKKKVAELDYERAAAALRRAEAGLNEARVYQGFTSITSPVSGIVTEKKIELGSMAVPGMPLLTVEDDSSYRLEISADESLTGRIKTGMEAVVTLESLGRQIKGVVSEVAPSVDPLSRSFLVKLTVSDKELRNGLYGKVSIPVGTKEALLVPKGSVIERGQLTGIYVVDDASVIKYRLVRTGRTYGDRVEVLSGLNTGEKVIVEGAEKAVDGGIAK